MSHVHGSIKEAPITLHPTCISCLLLMWHWVSVSLLLVSEVIIGDGSEEGFPSNYFESGVYCGMSILVERACA